jgi:DNA-binding transcriptional LysR family regulator
VDRLIALQVFRRVVELSSFSAAAADLGLSNAAVSKNVQELEAALGARLITRTTRRLSLTETGRLYYARIADVLDALEETNKLVADLSAAPRGTLRVNAPMSMGLTSIAPAVQDFLQRYPEVSIDLWMDDSPLDLIEGKFDVGIRGSGPLEDSSVVSRKLAVIERVVCAAPAYLREHAPIRAPEELAAHECLIYSLSSSPDVWTFRSGGQVRDVRVKGRYRANNSLAVRHAAVAGAGVALLPEFLVRNELRAGLLARALEAWRPAEQAVYALYPRHREQPRILRTFIDFLVERFTSGVPVGEGR